MLLAGFSAIEVLWIALSVFLLAFALVLVYLAVRVGATIARLTGLIRGLEAEVPPVINKVGGTVDRVNLQLDKLDEVTDSAVDAANSVDTAVRAISLALTRPVQKISGLAAGLSHGLAAFGTRWDWRDAFSAGRSAASRREHEIADELEREDRQS